MIAAHSVYDTLRVLCVYTGDPTGTGNIDTTVYQNMKRYRTAAFKLDRIAYVDALDAFQLLQATDSAGTGAKAISGAALSTFTSLAAVGAEAILEVDVGSLDTENNFFFVGARFSLAADTGVNTTVLTFLGVPNRMGRYLNTDDGSGSNPDPDNNSAKAA